MDCLRTSLAPVVILLWTWPALAVVGADAAFGADGPPEIVAGIKTGGDDQREGPPKPAEPPLAKYLTVTSPVDDLVFGRVKNAVLNLESQAQQQHRRAILILEITHGTTPFHQVYGLAKFLTSSEVADVKTVAWIPENVTGNNVVIALACNEIIMHPDADLGDIGQGKALDRDEQQDVLRLIEKRHNPRLSPALVLGMCDPQRETLRAKVQLPQAGKDGKETSEYRIVTKDELERLQKSKLAILDVQTIKEAGDLGTYSGSKARSLGVLTVQTIETRGELADVYNLPREALRDDPIAGDKPHVQLIKVEGVVDSVLEAFIERQIDRAMAAGVNTLIFEIDSPGGGLLQSQNLANAIADLDPKKIRTIAYIPKGKQALSGAAMIALGCDEIYMDPNVRIGDAEPIELRTGHQFEHVPEKILSNLRVVLATLAKRKGRPPALAEAMADKDLQVFQVKNRRTGRVWYLSDAEIQASNGEWERGLPVPESGQNHLLTLTGTRAHELGLAEAPVRDFDDLKQRLGIPAEVTVAEAKRTWVDTLVFVLNTELALFFLVVVGFICIYIELHLMTGLLSIIAALCFAVFFWSHFLGGTAGWLEVILFLIGALCLALEVFVIPGSGFFGVTGVLLIFGSLILASQTWGNLEPNEDYKRLSYTMGTLGASIVSIVVIAMVTSRFLPHVRVFDRLVLSPPGGADLHHFGPRLKPGLADEASGLFSDHPRSLIGQEGAALTVLRPAGKAKIHGRTIDVVSEGPFIPAESRVEVVEVSGNRVVVRQIV
jgi:membrane-bound serine protease (ClpP class)